MANKRNVALITGVTGQDGSYLSELLLSKGYDVHGIIRRSSVDFRERIAHLEGKPNFHLHYADLGDSMSITNIVQQVRPTEIYNLAAQSHVQVSFDSQNTRPTWMPWVCFASLRPCAYVVSHRPAAFTRLPPPSYMERSRKCLKTRIPLSTLTVLMQWPSSMASGLCVNIAMHTTCLPATAFSSTMRASDVARPS